jgi:hypothetical protein
VCVFPQIHVTVSEVKRESSRAKPRELGRFFPARHRAQIKITPHGETVLPPAVHRFAEPGIFIRRRSLGLAIPEIVRDPGAIRQNTGVSPIFSRTVLDIAPEAGLG